MFKPYLKATVQAPGKFTPGLGIELFRLDAIPDVLTEEEAEEAEEIKDQATGSALMRIYEEIGEDFWGTGGGMTAKKFAEELAGFGDIKRLNIHINSLGGDAFDAQAIHSVIKDHTSRKTSFIDGVAASAATIIACGANEVVGRINSSYMIHNPWGVCMGGSATMRKAADDLDAVTKPILNVYLKQVGHKIDEQTIRQLMEDETWMDSDQALEYGFINRIKGKIKAIAKVGRSQILCSGRVMDLDRYHYRNVPKFSKAKPITKEAETMEAELDEKEAPVAKVPPAPDKTKSKKIMTREDITPELLSEIEAHARTAERARLAALDGMAGPGLSEIIAKAKAEGTTPEAISMECFKVTQAQLHSMQKLGALNRDAATAGGVRAGDAPPNPPPPNPQERAKTLVLDAIKNCRPPGATVRAGTN